jgi:hypothetical protein
MSNGSTHLDAEFADDAALYLQGTAANLETTAEALDQYCLASGSKINWTKIHVIWASKNLRQVDLDNHVGFHWVEEGEGIHYLGPLIGFYLDPKANALPLIRKIKDKLHTWAGRHLSQAARILIINSVMLTTCWYIAGCCGIDKANCDIIRGIVRNYLWLRKEDVNAIPRVAWNLCTLSLTVGEIKILDPFLQTNALLSKIFIMGLTPGTEPWKILLRYNLNQARPTGSPQWPNSIY